MNGAVVRAFRRYAVWLLAVGVLGVALALYLNPESESGPSRERGAPAVAVEVGTIERRDLVDIRRLDGSLEARVRYDVAAKVGGELRSLPVRIGDVVERGALLARLDRREIEQEVAQADAELAVARADLAEAQAVLERSRRDLARVEELRERQIATRAELEAAEAQVTIDESREQLAHARIAQRQAALSAANIRLAFTEVRADWEADEGEARVVAERFVDPGATVSANEPLLSLLDLSELRAVVHVPERDYGRLAAGQRAQLQVAAHPERHFEAEIERIAPLFRAGTRQARVELQVPNPEGVLRPGMFARIAVTVGRAEDVVTVPDAALSRRGGETVIFLIEEGDSANETAADTTDADDGDDAAETAPPRARRVAVTTGLRADGRTAVVPHDESIELRGRVVTVGQHLIGDEAKVEIVGDLMEAL
ncbi:hypothetical protein CKO15_01190 [Halorhodospira abdelmalekii]|uniref:efflux RND transporter periplasmic adaptor subunit n=1 Tax=Halorhodospira abdelmalekii TaxID=421629 RepID=UPI001906E7BA|nr:efflux RND transporter periplasmic adaptor subunit [Halorhodospira abdelmalekii]MBK1733915.1 hypothetical protein [Halorhodospira abdelmalekii]